MRIAVVGARGRGGISFLPLVLLIVQVVNAGVAGTGRTRCRPRTRGTLGHSRIDPVGDVFHGKEPGTLEELGVGTFLATREASTVGEALLDQFSGWRVGHDVGDLDMEVKGLLILPIVVEQAWCGSLRVMGRPLGIQLGMDVTHQVKLRGQD